MQYGRIMGIDYGRVRIGIALTDLLKTIASPYEVYKSVSRKKDIEYFVKLIKEKEVDKIVLRAFGDELEKASNVPVVYQDERLSSVEAENYLLDGDLRRDKRKNLIDKVSASIILEDYLRSIAK